MALQAFDLAARAQSNQVTVHAVDLLNSCRSMLGPPCIHMVKGGLGCTEFKWPVALGYVSTHTGGTLATTIAEAVSRVRRMRGCKYLISFPLPGSKRSPKVVLKIKRDNLRLNFPSSIGNPHHEPTEREQQDALFLLPRFGQGIHAEVGLWPLRPSDKKKNKKWKALIVARLQRGLEDDWPDSVQRVEVEVVAHTGSKIYGKFRKVIAGDELVRFREGESRLLAFPVDGVRPRFNTVALRAVGVGGEVSANVRSWLDVPEPPGPGEAGPWIFVDRLAQLGDAITVLPALDGRVPRDHAGLVLGYGCPDEDLRLGEGRLVSLDGGASVPVPIGWLDGRTDTGGVRGCGWLAGRIEPKLPAGLWRFEPPAALPSADGRSCTVEIRVVDESEQVLASVNRAR